MLALGIDLVGRIIIRWHKRTETLAESFTPDSRALVIAGKARSYDTER